MYHYPAKILLFGEYSVIAGSEALAVPVSNFGATWHQSDITNESNQKLLRFLTFLSHESGEFGEIIDIPKFREALADGLYLLSDIPEGYGLGSSGTVCAAITDRFGREKISELSLNGLKDLFAKMERYFHGKSSGLDPLVSYLQKPVLVNSDKTLEIPEFSWQNKASLPEILLFDSGMPRSTGPLVQHFHDKLQNADFHHEVYQKLLPLVSKTVSSWINGSECSFDQIKQISAWQYTHMPEYIPNRVAELWKKYLDSDSLSFKLCGAGGGGFFLVFRKNNAQIDESEKVRMIPVRL